MILSERGELSYVIKQLRDMNSQDLNQVVAIERNAQLSPWSRLSFEESLNRKHYCRLLNDHDRLLGYHVTAPVLDELHILNVVVACSFQGRGHAHDLMQDIFDYSSIVKAKKIFLEVRSNNIVAQKLYLKWGFEQISVRKKYYQAITNETERQDAIVMLRSLEKHQ